MATASPIQITTMATSPLFSRPVHQLQPLSDARWAQFIQGNPRSSVFHTIEWLSALHRTYGYEPIAFTTSAANTDLQNAAVFCRVESWLTGPRLVSLPFSDHCEILAESATDVATIMSALEAQMHRNRLNYVEIRPIRSLEPSIYGMQSSYSYCLHRVDLRPSLDQLLANCHKSSTQRKIRRAQREGLLYQEGRSSALLADFYQLLLMTRRRHGTPPQPLTWFHNLIECFGEALNIRVAFKNRQPIAAILTLRHKNTLVYKYACSDKAFHPLGGVQFLLWKCIEEAKHEGLEFFDLGRSEWQNTGLITFKDRWGAARSMIGYSRLTGPPGSQNVFAHTGRDWRERAARGVFSRLPDYLFRAAGERLFRHLG